MLESESEDLNLLNKKVEGLISESDSYPPSTRPLVLSNLAFLSRFLGNYDQSIKSLSVAINLAKESNDLSGLASDYRNLGLALAASGDLVEARNKIAIAKDMSLKQGLKYNRLVFFS